MRIVGGATFRYFPSGTVFARYHPSYVDGISVKGEKCGEPQCWSMEVGFPPVDQSSADIINCLERGGELRLTHYPKSRLSVEENDQFLVFNRSDLEILVSVLQAALAQGYEVDRDVGKPAVFGGIFDKTYVSRNPRSR